MTDTASTASVPASLRVVANGLAHHVLDWPAPAAEPGTVVLLHGYLDVAATWLPFVRSIRTRLGPRCPRIIAPDLRGHGRTERVGAGGYYHFSDYVADVAGLVEPLGSPLVLVGHSMGGTVASLFAGTFPERVARLVLLEGLGPPSAEADTPPERMARWISEVAATRRRTPGRMPALHDVARRLAATHPSLTEPLANELASFASVPVEGGFAWAFDPLHRTRSPAPFDVRTYRSFLSRITCPTLLMEGAESPFRDYLEDDRESDLVRLERHVVPGAGHMLHLDRFDEVAAVVATFLAGARS